MGPPTAPPWTGEAIDNPPGLDQIAYRIADYDGFATEMLRQLPNAAVSDPLAPGGIGRPLKDVHVDESAAWIPALVRSWAQVGDILTFYQERIANEGYVQTAIEARSVDALQAEVGVRRGATPALPDGSEPTDQTVYRIDPGVAATAALAFTVVQAPNGPVAVPVPAGSAVRSHSTGAGAPQTFETSTEFTARLAWNAMVLRPPDPPEPAEIDGATLGVVLAGAQTGLKPGGRLLFLGGPDGTGAWAWRTIATVEPNRAAGTTLVTFGNGGSDAGLPIRAPQVVGFGRTAPLFGHDALLFGQSPVATQLANAGLLSGGVQAVAIATGVLASAGLNTGFPQAAIRDLALDATGAPYLATATGALTWANDAWNAANQGLSNRDVYALSVDDEGFLYAGTAGGGAFRTSSASNAWDVLPSGVYLDSHSNPHKVSLPRSVVHAVTAGALTSDAMPAPLLTTALTDDGLFGNIGDGWWPLALKWGTYLAVNPRVTAMGQTGATVFAAAQVGVYRAYILSADAGLTVHGGPICGDLGGEPLAVAVFGDDSSSTADVMVLIDGGPSAVLLFSIALTDPGTPPPPPAPPLPPPIDPNWYFNIALLGLPNPGTGRMLALCAATGPYTAALDAPRFFCIWDDGAGTVALYVNSNAGFTWLHLPMWRQLCVLAGGTPIALPPAYGVAADGDTALVLTPLSAPADWPDFASAPDGVSVVASGYSVTPGSWVALENTDSGVAVNAWTVETCTAGSRSAYGVTDKVLDLTVDLPGLNGLAPPSFDLRTTAAFLASRALSLAPPPAAPLQPAGGSALDLLGLIEPPPLPGQALAVSGQAIRARVARLGGVRLPSAGALLAADADVTALALAGDGRTLAIGTADEEVLLATSGGAGWRLSARPPGLSPAPILGLQWGPAGLVAVSTLGAWRLPPESPAAWMRLDLPAAPAALARSAEDLWLLDETGGVWRLRDGVAWMPAGVPDAPAGVVAFCVATTGDLFAAAADGVHRLPSGGAAWELADEGVSGLAVGCLAASPGGDVFAGAVGAGVFNWQADHWAAVFPDLPVRRVCTLEATEDGRLFVGGDGDGACLGGAQGWTAVPLGLSNVASSFALTDAGPLVGCRRMSRLLLPTPAPPATLGYQGLGRADDPDGALAAQLAQGLVTTAFRNACQAAGRTLSAGAAVLAGDDGGWILADGDTLVLAAPRPGAVTLGEAPDPLIAASAVGVDGTCALRLADGRIGTAQVLPADLVWQPAAATDPLVSEAAAVAAAGCSPSSDRRSTRLPLAAPLANLFDPATVRVTANVVEATQGQSVQEVLGSGDATLALQQFKLSQPPLTFVPAPAPAGSASTLTVLVNGAPWREVAALRQAGPEDQVYLAEITTDGGALITFGDGVHGARLPTGNGNVVAAYRSGMGPVGDTDAGMLTILLNPPAGIATATNPTPITPGRAPESTATVLQRAPGRVRAAGRLVTRDDYADYVAACAGVTQAASWELDAGGQRVLQVTVAGPGPIPLSPSDPVLTSIQAQVAARAAVPPAPVRIQPADVVTFDVRAQLWLTPDANPAEVLDAAAAAVLAAFSPTTRALAQPLYPGEVNDVLQATPGVAGVELLTLSRSGETPSGVETLTARPARWNAAAQRVEPAELLVSRGLAGVILVASAGGTPA